MTIFKGTSAANILNGGKDSDEVYGLDGDDTLTGGQGDDYLDGGGGNDTAEYFGLVTDYRIGYDSTFEVLTITDTVADRDGIDVVTGVEIFSFSKSTTTLAEMITLATATAPDVTPPTVASFSPANGAVGIDVAGNIILTFSEPIVRGVGSITLKTADGAIVVTYDASSSANLSILDNALTINPSTDLRYGTGYRVESEAGTIKDLAGNSYAGSTNYSFNTTGDTSSQAFTGNGSNELFNGGAGNDTIDGDGGVDTAIYSGRSTEYWVTYDSIMSTYSVKDAVSSRDGTDKLTSVELLQFSDGTKQLATSDALFVGRVYQSLFGTAQSSTEFSASLAKIGQSGSAFDWANVEASVLSTLSDSAFSTLVLNNMSINNVSLNATATFGTSQQAYDGLQQALTGYLSMVGSVNRGIVVAQLAQIIAGFEGETTFGVYGAAATAFNRQVASDLAHSINSRNASEVVAVPVFTSGTISAAGDNFEYMVAMGNYTYQIGGFGTGDTIISPTGVSGTLVNEYATDGFASVQFVSGGNTVAIALTGLTTAQDSVLFEVADFNTVFGLGTIV